MLPDDMSVGKGPGGVERRALMGITVICGHGLQLQAPLESPIVTLYEPRNRN